MGWCPGWGHPLWGRPPGRLGIRGLGQRMENASLRYKMKRYALRLCIDAYGKGIVRGHPENIHLRAYTKDNDITSAEAVRTSETISFFGGGAFQRRGALERQEGPS